MKGINKRRKRDEGWRYERDDSHSNFRDLFHY
jgi:hypothetical protein